MYAEGWPGLFNQLMNGWLNKTIKNEYLLASEVIVTYC